MGRRSDRRNDEHLRTILAQEAARIILNQGIDDYRTAKLKAAIHLGLQNQGGLPNNREIEAALAEHNRIFGGIEHTNLLHDLRHLALTVMHDLKLFRPCLVGPILEGNVGAHTSISLHLFSDAAETVAMELQQLGIRHNTKARNHRIQRDRVECFPGFSFLASDVAVDTTVFPERSQRHAPLSPVNGKPMQRAKLRDVERLTATC